MKKCQFCAEEIHDDAVICKHCGKKQKKPYGVVRLIIVGILVFFIFMTILVIVGFTGTNEPGNISGGIPLVQVQIQTSPIKPTAAPVPTEYAIGQRGKLGDTFVTVNKVEFSGGGGYYKPPTGNEWVNLNITVENNGTTQQFISTLGQMFVRDAAGNSYQISVTDRRVENPSGYELDGSIPANSKRTGWVGFSIPKEATGLKFQYNDDMWGSESMLVDLGR